MIEKWNNERIVIGVRHVDNVYSYATAIKELYPNRPLFVITGNNTTLKKRISICNELKKQEWYFNLHTAIIIVQYEY